MTDKIMHKIHPSNMPPRFTWILWLWMTVLTVKIFDLHEVIYWLVGVFAGVMFLGMSKIVSQTRYIDLFEVLNGKSQMTEAVEIVLASGKFARFRRVIALDLLLASRYEHFIAGMISRVVTLDDAALTYEDVLAMPADDFIPIAGKISTILGKINFKGVL